MTTHHRKRSTRLAGTRQLDRGLVRETSCDDVMLPRWGLIPAPFREISGISGFARPSRTSVGSRKQKKDPNSLDIWCLNLNFEVLTSVIHCCGLCCKGANRVQETVRMKVDRHPPQAPQLRYPPPPPRRWFQPLPHRPTA